MQDELADAVNLAITASQPAPSNEQETCFRIIDPLLRAMGYGPQEIKIQEKDHANQKPDYTILGDAPEFTWFLEAKAWSINLDDNHAIQAVNYANTQGKRWVVLSNGREWRLYDNHLIGTVDTKHACSAKLELESFPSLLKALSKASMQQGKLEDFVRNGRLYIQLSSQISCEDSDVIKAIVKALKNAPGLSNVRPADIVGFFSDYSAPPPSRLVPPPSGLPQARTATAPANVINSGGGSHQHKLGSLASHVITKAKPCGLVLPSGTQIPVHFWKDVAVELATYALQNGQSLSPPIYRGLTAKVPYLTKVGTTGADKMRQPQRLEPPFNDWQIETNISAAGTQTACANLLTLAGIDPDSVQIVLA